MLGVLVGPHSPGPLTHMGLSPGHGVGRMMIPIGAPLPFLRSWPVRRTGLWANYVRTGALNPGCAAMQLLHDRQQHTQHDILDPHERRVLKMLCAIYKSRALRAPKEEEEEEAYGSRGEGLRGLRSSA
jgi:hypothetical protein